MGKFKKVLVAFSLVFLFTLNTKDVIAKEVTAFENGSVIMNDTGLIEGEH